MRILGLVWALVRTILIVDPDLGFVFWLGRALDAVGFNALPAKDAADARRLVDELGAMVDLLVLRAGSAEPESLIQFLRDRNPHLRVMAARETGQEGEALGFDAQLAFEKPERPDDEAQRAWIDAISSLFGAAGSSS